MDEDDMNMALQQAQVTLRSSGCFQPAMLSPSSRDGRPKPGPDHDPGAIQVGGQNSLISKMEGKEHSDDGIDRLAGQNMNTGVLKGSCPGSGYDPDCARMDRSGAVPMGTKRTKGTHGTKGANGGTGNSHFRRYAQEDPENAMTGTLGGAPLVSAGPDNGGSGLISWGKTYIVSTLDAKEQSFSIFDELLKNQVKGLCISNELPKRIFERYDTFVMKVLNNDPTVIMLNEDKMSNVKCIHPLDTDGLVIDIRNFAQKYRNSVLLLDGLAAILINNPKEAYKVGQFLLYLRKLMEENENILIIPVHPDLLDQPLFREILPLLQGAPNFHFVYHGNLRFDPEKITLVDNTLCESRLEIQRDNVTRMWHDLRGVVRLGMMPTKEFYILSDRKPIQDLNVRVLDGKTGQVLEFDPVGFEDTTMKLVIHFPRALKPGEEYRIIIEYLTTAFQAVGDDFYLHSVVRPINEIKTLIKFPEGVRIDSIDQSDYQFAGDLKRSLQKFPSKDHHFSVSKNSREIMHSLKDSPERCMFRIIWNTQDTRAPGNGE